MLGNYASTNSDLGGLRAKYYAVLAVVGYLVCCKKKDAYRRQEANDKHALLFERLLPSGLGAMRVESMPPPLTRVLQYNYLGIVPVCGDND